MLRHGWDNTIEDAIEEDTIEDTIAPRTFTYRPDGVCRCQRCQRTGVNGFASFVDGIQPGGDRPVFLHPVSFWFEKIKIGGGVNGVVVVEQSGVPTKAFEARVETPYPHRGHCAQHGTFFVCIVLFRALFRVPFLAPLLLSFLLLLLSFLLLSFHHLSFLLLLCRFLHHHEFSTQRQQQPRWHLPPPPYMSRFSCRLRAMRCFIRFSFFFRWCA